MINNDKIYARIDRPSLTIKLGRPQNASKKMDLWIGQVNKIVELVDLVAEKVERRIAVE